MNSDGTGWHESHAFGDFCYICHAGNNQAVEKDAAHTGMVLPLSDVKASCQQCHPGDLEERAQVYAAALGVEIGAGGASESGDEVASSNGKETAPSPDGGKTVARVAPPATELVVDDPNLVDYVQRYNEVVLGKRPINIGNAILIGLIVLLVVGGGGYVLYNEGWVQVTTEPLAPVPEGYPEDIVEMLPKLQKLTDKGRRGLQNLVEEPEAADELLDVLARHIHKGA